MEDLSVELESQTEDISTMLLVNTRGSLSGKTFYAFSIKDKNKKKYNVWIPDSNKRKTWFDLLQKQILFSQKDRIFGRPLNELWERNDTVNFIPAIVKNIIEYISSDEKCNFFFFFFFSFFFFFFFFFLLLFF